MVDGIYIINLPELWSYHRLGECCRKISDNYEPQNDGKKIYLGLEHLNSGFPSLAGKGNETDVRSTKNSFKENDVLFGKLRPYLRKAVLANFDGICSTDIFVIRAADKILPSYLIYLIHSDHFIKHAIATTSGVQHPRTSWSAIERFMIPVPSRSEQKKIAHILSTIQRAIEQQERLIQVTTELKKTLMHKLFTEGTRGEPQKETEIGVVPENWTLKKIGDIARFQTGGTPSRDNPKYWQNGTIPWVKTTEINYKEIDASEEFITEEGLNNSAAKILNKGTLLVAMYGQGITRGRVAILGLNAATNQACAAIKPHDQDQILTWYLFYYLQYHYQDLRDLGHGANQRNLNMELIKSFPLCFPEKGEQNEIVNVFKSIDKKIGFSVKKKYILKDLFRTLLHQLMTAQIRVHEIEFEENV